METRGDIKRVSEKYSISQSTAKKYLLMSKEEINALDNPVKYVRKKKEWLNEFSNIIYKMTVDGHRPKIVYAYIMKKGYPGSERSLSALIECILMNNFGIVLSRDWNVTYEYPNTVTVITRNDIIKYISQSKRSNGTEEVERNMSLIKEKYPVVKQLDEIYTLFHFILMSEKEDELEMFIEKYESSVLEKFVKGIKKDIHPTKNAISFRESSGFVEGNNNKFKLIKRILYGRSNLDNLFRKCYPAFLIGKHDFNLKKVLLNSKAYTHY